MSPARPSALRPTSGPRDRSARTAADRRSRPFYAFALAAWLGAAGCCERGPAYPRSPEWDAKARHFVDPEGAPRARVTPWSFLTRRLGPNKRWLDDHYRPPTVRNDGQLLRDGALGDTVTWIGHASTLVQLAGWNVLTDPVWAERLPFIPRHAPPGLAIEALPLLDAVIVSHDHVDHLDEETVLALRRRFGAHPVWVVPLGIGAWLRARGIERVVELDWWEKTTLADEGPRGRPALVIELVPARHWGQRCADDRLRRLWGSFVLAADGAPTVFFGGDTAYGPQFQAVRERSDRPIDVAILPIGAYEPRAILRTRHESPEEAARAFRDLGARWLVPIHWGTFRLSEEPMAEPPERLLRALGPDAPHAYVLPIGGTLRIPSSPRAEAR